MKNILTLIALIGAISILKAQETQPITEVDSILNKVDSISRWEDMDLATTNWHKVKHVFVPTDISKSTLILETHTQEQHENYFKKLMDSYYVHEEIDTSIATYKKGIPHYIKNQQKEIHYFKQHYKGTLESLNESEIEKYNVEEYRYVLKKILKIQNVNPESGQGEAYIEYFFLDRKENKEYAHINAGYHWLITHLNH